MSTSRSDRTNGGGGAGDASGPEGTDGSRAGSAGNTGKTGVGSMFKRAVVAYSAKPEASAAVADGIEQIVCEHCGAPRRNEERICHFCQRSC